MIELRKIIQNTLSAIHPRLYYQSAPDDAVFPYLVYDLPNSVDDGSMERFILDVDGWDDKRDTTALETLMDAADTALNGKTEVIDGLGVVFYRESRLSLVDDDPRIQRRKYIYQARTF